MNHQLITIFIITLYTITLSAQSKEEIEHHHEEHQEGHKHHEHHKHEIGVANALVYFTKEQEFSYGLHLHYVYTIKESKFGIGLGYEHIFDEHKHNTVGVVGSYRPIKPLSFIVSPGVAFEGVDEKIFNFALHIETAYEWEIGNFHLGPVFEFAYDPLDYHISLGLHVGYGF